MGTLRTLSWTVISYAFAFISEFSSTRYGIPYGWYSYVESTRGLELWVGNVPFMDSVSYSFLTYTGYSMAVCLLAPLWRRGVDIRPAETRRLRRSWKTLLLGAFITTLLDVVIDPVALRGNRWFLGQIYEYHSYGIYFGIPFTNFVGWFLVSVVIISLNQVVDYWLPKVPAPRNVPGLALGGPLLYVCLLGFNLAVTVWLREWMLLGAGLLWHVWIGWWVLARWRAAGLLPDAVLREHLRDFPSSPLKLLQQGRDKLGDPPAGQPGG